MKKPNLRAKTQKAKDARGRPPTHFTYDPKSIPGLRDQGRARAAASIPELIELAERMYRAGLGILRGLDQPTARVDEATAQPAQIGAQLAGKVVETTRDGAGDGWTSQTVEERRPFGGLEWDDVKWAADYLSDRCGFSRKTDIDAGGDLGKIVDMLGYTDKDGVRHIPEDDPEHP